jgi:nucleotide-binding universal stress UspA family protein
VLLAIQGEEESKAFIGCALDLAKFYGASVTALHIRETSLAHYGYVDQLAGSLAKEQFVNYIHDRAAEREKQAYASIRDRAGELDQAFGWITREGHPADEIQAELKGGSYDLLILGTKPLSPGNTSSKVKEMIAKKTPCAVFILK